MSVLPAKRGDTLIYVATALDARGQPFDFTNCALWFTIKDSDDRTPSDARAIASLSWQDNPRLSTGIAVADVTTGVATLTVPSSATVNLRERATYKWDFQVRDSLGNIETQAEGTLAVDDDVTIRTTVP